MKLHFIISFRSAELVVDAVGNSSGSPFLNKDDKYTNNTVVSDELRFTKEVTFHHQFMKHVQIWASDSAIVSFNDFSIPHDCKTFSSYGNLNSIGKNKLTKNNMDNPKSDVNQREITDASIYHDPQNGKDCKTPMLSVDNDGVVNSLRLKLLEMHVVKLLR